MSDGPLFGIVIGAYGGLVGRLVLCGRWDAWLRRPMGWIPFVEVIYGAKSSEASSTEFWSLVHTAKTLADSEAL